MTVIQADKAGLGRTIVPHLLFVRHPGLCIVSIVASFSLSLWAIYLDPVVNYDGILYIDAARYFASGQWVQAFGAHKWPFYSIVISLVSTIAGLSITHAAYLANAVLYALLILGFVGIFCSLDGNRRFLWLAAVVALLHPAFNEFRAFIIRDVGYWAFYLWSLAYFFSYLQARQKYLLILALVLGAVAFLFRVEGIVLLIVLSVCLLTKGGGGKPSRGIVLSIACGIMVVVAVSFPLWEYTTESAVSVESLLSSPFFHLANSWKSISLDMFQRLDALVREFPSFATNMPTFLVYATMSVAIFVSETIDSLGIVYVGLFAYALISGKGLIKGDSSFWWWSLVAAHAFLVLVFAFSKFFLADRYCVALAMTLLIIVPFVLGELCSEWRRGTRRHKWWIGLVAVLLLVEGADGLDVRTDKQYLREAGLWLRANTSPGSTIYTNNRILLHYSGVKVNIPRPDYSWEEAMRVVWTGKWRDYDYLALVIIRNQTQNEVLFLRMVGVEALKEFHNQKGDKVLIFRGSGNGG